jgi:hypothetical protein
MRDYINLKWYDTYGELDTLSDPADHSRPVPFPAPTSKLIPTNLCPIILIPRITQTAYHYTPRSPTHSPLRIVRFTPAFTLKGT